MAKSIAQTASQGRQLLSKHSSTPEPAVQPCKTIYAGVNEIQPLKTDSAMTALATCCLSGRALTYWFLTLKAYTGWYLTEYCLQIAASTSSEDFEEADCTSVSSSELLASLKTLIKHQVIRWLCLCSDVAAWSEADIKRPRSDSLHSRRSLA